MALKTKNRMSIEIIFQVGITLFALYVANKTSIDLWRSVTGH